jgi:phosphopantetheinyl transferase
LAGGGPLFSLAYSDGMALIAAASAGHGPAVLGVDLEADRRIAMPARRRAEIVAAASGLAGMPAAGPPDDAAFLLAWARLEAFAKAHGRGLGRTLVDLGLRAPGPRHLSLEEIEERARSLADRRAVRVHDLALPKGHYGALAMPRSWSPPPVRALPCSLRALERQLHL